MKGTIETLHAKMNTELVIEKEAGWGMLLINKLN